MAGLKYADRVQVTSTTTGTGDYTLDAAVSGFQDFTVFTDGDRVGYCCEDGVDWEVGLGTTNSGGTVLARTKILASSNARAAVNWGAGTRNVFCTLPASLMPLLNSGDPLGLDSVVTGYRAVVSGGYGNSASYDGCVVGGGRQNTSSALYCVVAGGRFNTSSGKYSAVCGGQFSIASGDYSAVSGGYHNTADGHFSTIAGGYHANTRGIYGMSAIASGKFSAQGDAQEGGYRLRVQTTDNTQTALTADAGAQSTTNQVVLPDNSSYAVRGIVVAREPATGDTKTWEFSAGIKRGANAASTAMVIGCTPTVIGADIGATSWTLDVSADTTNGGLQVRGTGENAKTIQWVAVMRSAECVG